MASTGPSQASVKHSLLTTCANDWEQDGPYWLGRPVSFIVQTFPATYFFNYSVPDLNKEPPVEYSYGTIDLNAEPNADVGFDSQASYGFVYDDSKQSYTEEGYEEKPGASNVNWETKEVT
ncbi:hypothetical protein E3N88_05805 [Mikania micrantha]|uniref:Uncharacterized protein n=1 Tax=Mikania micrantha TaxID=192012 RepID=A0A5N6PPX8_9ASTR|nr:hypothetical protein E3N88_05805 [Mikania micrantha]